MHEEIPGVAVDGPPRPKASSLDDGNRVRFHPDGLASLDADAREAPADASLEELNELYEIRFTLEPLATEIATTRLSDEELVGLETHRGADARCQPHPLCGAEPGVS